jgi:hypothetical protein
MPITVSIRDENASGKIFREIDISLSGELVNVKEIIQSRVYAEVDAYNSKMPEYFNGLVEPSDAESSLNGYKLKNKRKIDPSKQTEIAYNAFQNNGFFILIDSIQAHSLDQMVVINERTEISFVKLTPLVGG